MAQEPIPDLRDVSPCPRDCTAGPISGSPALHCLPMDPVEPGPCAVWPQPILVALFGHSGAVSDLVPLAGPDPDPPVQSDVLPGLSPSLAPWRCLMPSALPVPALL